MKFFNHQFLLLLFVVILVAFTAINIAEESSSPKETESKKPKEKEGQSHPSPFSGVWDPSSEMDLFEDVFAPMERYFDRIRSHTASLMDQAFENRVADSPFSRSSSWPSFRRRWSPSSSSSSSSSFSSSPPWEWGKGLISSTTPRMDLHESEKEYWMDCDLPGVRKEDIDVSLSDDNILTIKGHRDVKKDDDGKENSKESEKEKAPSLIRQERYHSEFERRMRLSDEVDRENIEAKLENGVLHLKLPKIPSKKPSVHKIDIQ
eukprot:gb/GECH01011783.1/.p1 GENE.gb/GECH01011783.1/~~gb/GECH01011783.1/.p1  ORF type:complete len:262 (+),score=85.76 gb/GECH01011783.1/:1-786(+)